MSEITILNPRAENAVPVTAYALSANIGVPGPAAGPSFQ